MKPSSKVEFSEVMGLDVGEKRIGVARASAAARLPEPLTTVINDDKAFNSLSKLISEQGTDLIVVGLPRSLNGGETEQTQYSRDFAERLKELNVPVELQDEALTSKKAQTLISEGVYKKNALGGPVTVDEVAACLILEDHIAHKEMHV